MVLIVIVVVVAVSCAWVWFWWFWIETFVPGDICVIDLIVLREAGVFQLAFSSLCLWVCGLALLGLCFVFALIYVGGLYCCYFVLVALVLSYSLVFVIMGLLIGFGDWFVGWWFL